MSQNTRLARELRDAMKGAKESGVSFESIGDSLNHFRGKIQGPPDSPYQGGEFLLDIVIPPQYPFEPPKIKFLTRVWHPNVSSQTGVICLDILRDEWSPALTIKTALLSISALLTAAVPEDPQDAVVAAMYKDDHPAFERKAAEWTRQYASPGQDGAEIQALTAMGFTREQAQSALEKTGWNQEQAIELLLSGA